MVLLVPLSNIQSTVFFLSLPLHVEEVRPEIFNT